MNWNPLCLPLYLKGVRIPAIIFKVLADSFIFAYSGSLILESKEALRSIIT